MGLKTGRPTEDIQGQRFGRLLVVAREGSLGKHAAWSCLCDCGATVSRKGTNLRSGKTKSCGCYARDSQQSKIKKALEARGCRGGLTGELTEYRRGALRRGLGWLLTDEEAISIMTSPCHYCGAPPSKVPKSRYLNRVGLRGGIDRIDSSLGYENLNCVPCCSECNRAKGTLPASKFFDMCLRVASHQNLNTYNPPPTQEDNTMKWAVQ